MTDPEGNEYGYAYIDAFPNTESVATGKKLSVVTYPDSTTSPTDNPKVTYLYENTNFPTFLTGIQDELNVRYATWTYDTEGRVTNSKHANDTDSTTIVFNTDGTKTVTFPLGEVITYTFQTYTTGNQTADRITREDRAANGTIPAAYRTYSYDSNGFVSSMRDWNGNITNYVHDANGLETSRTEAYGTAQARTITTTWNTSLRVPTQIVETGKTTDFTYDTSGNLLTKTETDTTTNSVPYSTNGQTRTWTYTYDSLGNVLTENGPRTDVTDTTTYTYTTTAKNLATVTNALSQVTNITSYDDRGLPLSITDPNSVVTNLTYDEMGRLKSQTIVASGGNAVTSFDYNLAGLLVKITLPDATELNYEYDEAQRLKAVENSADERIEYTLDNAGNITQEKYKTSTGSIRKQQSQTFDVLGRLLKNIGILSTQTTTYGYDSNSNRTSSKDARNYTTNFAFDALNRLITVTDPLSKVATTTYDSRDNVTAQSDFRPLTTTYVYDGWNRVIQTTSPDSGTTVYTLDKAGNVTSETDARAVVTNRTFDALNRVATETFPAASSENIAYTYDSTASGNKGIGLLTGFTDESGSTTLKYDERGNMIQKVSVIGGITYTTSYTYNLVDQITKITYPSGRQVYYNRNTDGQLRIVYTRRVPADPLSEVVTLVREEPFGPLRAFTYGNGLNHTRTFDKNYWLTGITTTDGTINVQNLALGYDDAGNITSITDNLDSSRNQTFTYEALNRLSGATGAYGTLGYTYDNNGNRKTATVGSTTETYTYPSTSNKLSNITGGSATRSFTYKTNGNVSTDTRGASDDVGHFYSNRDRLNRMSINSVNTLFFKHNARGERVIKTVGTVSRHFQYDESGHLIAESDASGNVIREYVWLNDMPVAQFEASGTTYYIHADQLGTPQKMTNASKAVVWDRQWLPFGEDHLLTGTATNPLRFPGQYADDEVKLNYNYFRDYDSSVGRYIEVDPIGLDGGLNVFGYANQNPISNFDIYGNLVWVAIPGICAGGGCEAAIGAIGLAATLSTPAGQKVLKDAGNQICNSNNGDPCGNLLDKMNRHMDGMERKYSDLTNDKKDLFNKAYNSNPGGDLAGFGYWTGHTRRYNGLKDGLRNMVNQAQQLGCPVPARAYDLLSRPTPESPMR